LAGGDAEVAALLKKLKTALGSGGGRKGRMPGTAGDVADEWWSCWGRWASRPRGVGGSEWRMRKNEHNCEWL
ncbi:hypothetical protein CLOM_g11092, partial [Closterium sp. NIES-68]